MAAEVSVYTLGMFIYFLDGFFLKFINIMLNILFNLRKFVIQQFFSFLGTDHFGHIWAIVFNKILERVGAGLSHLSNKLIINKTNKNKRFLVSLFTS